MTGRSSSGMISFTVLEQFFIEILSPEPRKYNFSDYNSNNSYPIDLKVISNRENISRWSLTLIDEKHDKTILEDEVFFPNTTLDAVRWNNSLEVVAYLESSNRTAIDSVSFFVNVPNQEPYPPNISTELYACENQYFNEPFTVIDVDEQDLDIGIYSNDRIFAWDTDVPIYARELSRNLTETKAELYTPRKIEKRDVGFYPAKVRAIDPEDEMSETSVNVSVIEVNNPPEIEDLTAETVWTRGVNSTFYKEVYVYDKEDGNRTSSDLNFSINFSNERLFNISQEGVMNFSAENYSLDEENTSEVHDITLCVVDSGLENVHENISVCDGVSEPLETCKNFSLTITNENRPPTILEYFPENETFNASGTEELYFNISKFDPDGTIPDSFWYVDENKKEFMSGNSVDEFSYTFPCNVGGEHNIAVDISDGLLNDSLIWTINIKKVACPEPPPSSGGGGGGGVGSYCNETWICSQWAKCQNLEKTLEIGVISGEDYREIKEKCNERGLDEKSCGLQIRNCSDQNNCNTTVHKPEEISECHFSENPNCNDGIKNCHNGSCEFMVDCGGPCPPCATCNDGIQNQGEEGIDCGGPCPEHCEPEIPREDYTLLILIFIILIIVIIIILIVGIRRIKRLQERLEEKNMKQE